MSENNPDSESLRADPAVITRYLRYLITPFVFAAMAYAISGTFATGVIVFLVMLSMAAFDIRKKIRREAAMGTEPAPSTTDASRASTDPGPAVSTNAVDDLKRKLEQLRNGNSLEGVGVENDSRQLDTAHSDQTGSTFEQEMTESTPDESETRIVERMNSPAEVQAARTDPTELQTQIWMQKLRDLDESVAYGKTSDEEYERQYRRIMAAYNN